MKYIAIILLACILTGCASLQSYDAKLAGACSTYAHMLYSLAAVKQDMTPGQINTVNDVRIIANPICQDHDYNSAQSALQVITQQVARLNGIEVSQ